jgi:hypothetical protein
LKGSSEGGILERILGREDPWMERFTEGSSELSEGRILPAGEDSQNYLQKQV